MHVNPSRRRRPDTHVNSVDMHVNPSPHSDLAQTFCPTVEDTKLPEAESQWDSDGLPKWIEIGLRDWKTRSRCHEGKRYGMRLHRNYLDSRFCPVTWLLTWLHFSGIEKGPLFQSSVGGNLTGETMSIIQWTGATTKLFTAAGLYFPAHTNAEGVKIDACGVTNHGIRRSATQWAGRCGGRQLDVMNNGRWRTLEEMAKYMAQGATRRRQHEQDSGVDPIFSTWVWKPVTIGAESTHNEL